MWQNKGVEIRVIPGTRCPPNPTTQHKSHILNVMFVVAMARPQARPDGSLFDGKIGCWACVETKRAARNSARRPAGTIETVPKSLDSEYYRELMTGAGGIFEKVKNKMPWLKDFGHYIQHDGAKPHNGGGNVAHFDAEGVRDGWHIKVVTQPAQSPDLNIMDLGLFNSLKHHVNEVPMASYNIDTLITKVCSTYTQYPWDTLDRIWALQIDVWSQVLEAHGGNDYRMPHKGAARVPTEAVSKVDLVFDVELYNDVFNMLN